MATIYYVEDDQSIGYIIEKTLEHAGIKGVGFQKIEDFMHAFRKLTPDMVLLDIMLPDGSGLDVLKLIRSTHKELPIMMISALQSEMDKVIALDLGADDYMTKPFGVLEMTSRIQARLRKADHHILISLGNVTIDDQKHICVMNNKEVYLTNKEYSILKLLIKHKGNVLSKESIFQQVWETNYMGETRTLDMHIKSLRQKLMSYHANVSISTIRGIGYQIL
ncbi:MAG: response regulator transcription factor [Acholeplasmataceae bacterium]|jgi:two-component system alkaline phosphatase synthesis response regulator PhoP|nr:response regulator transcription factor [Acholeplasmataceae bacterium]